MHSVPILSVLVLYTTFHQILSSVTFSNINVQYQTNNGAEYTFYINASTLKTEIPESDISRITIVGNSVISKLPKDAILDFPNLKIFQIRQQQLEVIEPEAFKNLPNLEILRLSGNQLKEIQDGVFDLPNLIFLNLDHNRIGKISKEAFRNLRKLEVLDLGNNRIRSFYAEWLQDKPSLSYVSLTYNEIEELPFGALESYHNDIDLSNNRIRNISRDIFGRGNTVLGHFSLSDNGIQKWENNLLEDLKIRSFDISRNNLECLDGSLDDFFVATQTRIDGNPWSCECLKKISEWVIRNKKHVFMKSSVKKCNLTQK